MAAGYLSIGHFTFKEGHLEAIRELELEWERTIRPGIPGMIAEFIGVPVDRANETVHVVLMQDEETYRNLAALPAQDAWYRKLLTHLEQEPTWEDVSWDAIRLDSPSTKANGHAQRGATSSARQTTTT